jgi:DNA-directed RNA polymerase subunit RPC12/RpoP
MSQFPPPDYVAVASAVDGIEVYAPARERGEATEEVVEFKCPRCQATTAYSVEDGGLRCAHCGYYEPPETEVVGKGAREFEFTVDVVAAAREAQGWGTARTSLQCQNCGAETSLPPGNLTHTCPFCGSNRVVQQDAPQEALRPRFLIPFQVEASRCQQITREWLGSSWMTPKSLRETARVADFRPVYLPYWTFDARTDAPWRAQVGHTVTERYYDAGSKSWKTRTKTVWRWESGRARRRFDDMLVPGTSRLSALLLSRVQDFDTGALVPYAPAFLAGMLAQAYNVQLEAAWANVRERMREETRQACRRQASTSQIRNFSMALDFADESWRYVLLPVYVAVYRYEGESYQVLINGQTGTIAGQRPVDWNKVWLAVAGMLAPGVLLGLLGLLASALGLVLPPSLIAGGGILVVAFILLVIGIVFAVITITKARSLDDA